MKVLRVDGRRGLSLAEVAEPELRPGQLRIRAACSLVSPGTELHYLERSLEHDRRLRLGYCSSGHVEAVGEGTEGFHPGDRVIAMGWGYAHHAEWICVPYKLCVRVPDDLPFERAVFANLAATALHAVHRARLRPGAGVLVVGAGLVGQLVAQCAAGDGRRVHLADRVGARVRAAGALGAVGVSLEDGAPLGEALRDGDGEPAIDRVFLCVTGDATGVLAESIELLSARAAGPDHPAIVCVGRFRGDVSFSVEMGNLDIRYAARCGAGYRDDDYVHGRRGCRPPAGEGTVDQNLARCLRWIVEGKIRPQAMRVLDVDFSDAVAAYERLRRGGEAVSARLLHGASP